MTGSAMKCNGMEMDVVLALLLGEKLKGGGLGEGGSKIAPGRRVSDDGKRKDTASPDVAFLSKTNEVSYI